GDWSSDVCSSDLDVFTCLRWCVIVRAYPDLWFCRYSPGCYRGACPTWKDSNARWAPLGVRGVRGDVLTCLCAYVFTCLRLCIVIRAYSDSWFCRYFPGCYRLRAYVFTCLHL